MPSTCCAIKGCTNGKYRLRKWKRGVCPRHVCCRYIQGKCDCPPPYHLRCFPADTELRRLWVKAVNRVDVKTGKNWQPGHWDRICTVHFEEGLPYPTLDLGHSQFNPGARPRSKLVRQRGRKPDKKADVKEETIDDFPSALPVLQDMPDDCPNSPSVLSVQEMTDDSLNTLPVLPVQEKVYMDDHHSNLVMRKLSQLWQQELLCDASINNGTSHVKTHKVVLTAACPMLLSLNKDIKAGNTAILTVNVPCEIGLDTISAFLVYIYDGILRLTVDTLHQMIRLAKIMKEDAVLGYCEDFQRSVVHVNITQEPVEPDLGTLTEYNTETPPSSHCSFNTMDAASTIGTLGQNKASVHHVQTDSSLPAPHKADSPSSLLSSNEMTLKKADIPSSSLNKTKILTPQKAAICTKPSSFPGRSLLTSFRADSQHSTTLETSCKADTGAVEFDLRPPSVVTSHSTLTGPGTSPLSTQITDNNPKPGTMLLLKSKSGPQPVYKLLSLKKAGTPSSLPTYSVLPLTEANPSSSISTDNGLLTETVDNCTSDQLLHSYGDVKTKPSSLSAEKLKDLRDSRKSVFFTLLHQRKNDYKCKKCSVQLFTDAHVDQHMKTIHQIHRRDAMEYVVAEPKSDPKVNACGICEYQPRARSHLQFHRYVQHQIPLSKKCKIFRCDVCSKELFRESALLEHLNVHKDHASYVCDICGMGFGRKQSLNNHVYNCHNDERRFVCKECGKGFKNRLQIRIHLRSHTGIRPFKCPQCLYEGTTKGNLKVHMLKHHGQSIDEVDVPACEDVHLLEDSVTSEGELMEVLPYSKGSLPVLP